MNFDDLHKMIADSTISDDEAYRALRKIWADQFDNLGSIVPMTNDDVEQLVELGTLNLEMRPSLHERLKYEFMEEHSKDCSECHAMKKKSEA